MSENLKDFLTIDDFDLKGRTVLVRADINSVVIDGNVQMKERIEENAKTIRELSEKKAKVVILAHQGRAGGHDFLPLEQHAQLLRNFVDLNYIDDIIGPAAREAIKNLDAGEVLLLDNVRMLAEETLTKSPEEHAESIFVKKLAPLADVYINDAFSVAHRSHASVVGFPKVMNAGIGRLMERELRAMVRAVHRIKKPCIYVLGGVKPEEVFDIMEFALTHKKVNSILTTGALGTIFLYARGIITPGEKESADTHFVENLERAKRILAIGGDKIKYPEDVAVESWGKRVEIPVEVLKPKQHNIYDIGERTSKRYADLIRDAKTVIMKGPAGFYEKEAFRKGTEDILHALSSSDAYSLIGGGHTSAAMSTLGINKTTRTHVSLAGGAFLKYLLEKSLPGIDVLRKR
jgi:phosphoglycerate kinase